MNKDSDKSKDTDQEKHDPRSQSKRRWIIENVVSLVLALLIVLMIRSSVIEAFKIPSGSMIPTLFIGDHIFVNKFAYGLKVPFSDLITGQSIYLWKRESPKRGDVVVFIYPKDESIYYIKRIVGIPGDVIEIRNKILYVNSQRVIQDELPMTTAESIFKSLDEPGRYSASHLDIYTEHLTGVDHLAMLDKTSFLAESFGPITVPNERYFVMGDNRDFSNDSRAWGFVPINNIKGRAIFVWLSFWINFSESQYMFRPDRIGKVIQ